MNKCPFYKEEHPYFSIIGEDGIENKMIPVCSRPGIELLGLGSDIVFCEGKDDLCPFHNSKNYSDHIKPAVTAIA
ncbi:MAG: hypothetical protein PQJ58_20745 [Spirochaetales bacterium]|nr:hypothetical protein [Spirochaetales bacterium]